MKNYRFDKDINLIDDNLVHVNHDGVIFSVQPKIKKVTILCFFFFIYSYSFFFQKTKMKCSLDKIDNVLYCSMKYGSWTYDGFKIDVTSKTLKADTSNLPLASNIIVNNTASKNVKYYPCCTESYPDITYYLNLKNDS